MNGHEGEPDDQAGHHEEVGSVAEEAAKLFAAFSDLAGQQGADLGAGLSGVAAQAAAAARGLDEHLATGGPECTYCPVCRAVHAVRQTSPEVRAHLASAASSLLQAAAGLLATAVPDDARSAPGVERIDLDGADGADDEWVEDE